MPTNFIFILADDLGYADLGCQGSAEAKTPNVDSIAAHDTCDNCSRPR